MIDAAAAAAAVAAVVVVVDYNDDVVGDAEADDTELVDYSTAIGQYLAAVDKAIKHFGHSLRLEVSKTLGIATVAGIVDMTNMFAHVEERVAAEGESIDLAQCC